MAASIGELLKDAENVNPVYTTTVEKGIFGSLPFFTNKITTAPDSGVKADAVQAPVHPQTHETTAAEEVVEQTKFRDMVRPGHEHVAATPSQDIHTRS